MTAAQHQPARLRRWRRVGIWTGGTVLALALITAGLLWWSGSEGSLANALQLARRLLPAGQQLVFSNVQGSIRGGGHIGHLRWSGSGTTVELHDLQLDWTLLQLLRRDLHIRTLSIQRVQVRLAPQPEAPAEPFIMPADASLPIRLSMPLDVGRFELESLDAQGESTIMVLEAISANYRFDGDRHVLHLEDLQYGQSRLQADAGLHAITLDIELQANATLRDLVPDSPLAMQARLTADGSLAGGDDAAIAVAMEARETDESPSGEASLQGNASIHPWRDQPLQQVELQLNELDMHAFAAQAPVTAFSGSASLHPTGDGATNLEARIDISNRNAGPWDQQQLPVRQLTARASLSAQEANIESLAVELGGMASRGSITLAGLVPLQRPAQSSLQLDLRQVDLQSLLTTLPHTALAGEIRLEPGQTDDRRIEADIRNGTPGPLDQERAPFDRLVADVRMTPDQWRVEVLDLHSGAGQARLRGNYFPQTRALDLRAQLQQLPLQAIHANLAGDVAARLSGSLSASGVLDTGLDFDIDLAGSVTDAGAAAPRGEWEVRAVQTRGRWTPDRLIIERIHADALQLKADGRDIDVSLPEMDTISAHLTAQVPGMSLAADATMQGESGGGSVSLQLLSAQAVEAWLAGLPVIGAQLPDMDAQGTASLDAEWQGGWRQWINAIPNPSAAGRLQVDAQARAQGLRINLPESETQSAIRIEIPALDLQVQGNPAAARIAIDGDARANDMQARINLRLQTAATSAAGGDPQWTIDVERFAAEAMLPDRPGPWALQVTDDLQFMVQTGDDIELRASAGTATLAAPASIGAPEPLVLDWQPVTWRRTSGGAMTLVSAGIATGLQPAWLDSLLAASGEGPLRNAGLQTDLLLRGEWNVQMTDQVSIRLQLQRESGDLRLIDSQTSAGIQTIEATLQSADENLNASLVLESRRAGSVAAQLATRLDQQADGWRLPPDAPLSGEIQARLDDLAMLAVLVPPGWRIQGAIDADVQLDGTIGTPQLAGSINGSGLNVRSVLDGVELHDGTLRASLRDSQMQITELAFQGGTGSRAHVRGFSGNLTPAPKERGRMTARGLLDWSGATGAGDGIEMQLDADLQRMQVLVRNDRQMTLSGKLSAGLDDGNLRVRGDLTVNRASILLPDASAPTLGDDVVVLRGTGLSNPSAAEARQARGEFESRKPMDLEISLDLGQDLAIEGEGITTRLEGELTVRSTSTGSSPIALVGEVRTVQGRYRAWGQELDVETGVVRFNGPYGNPSIELLAIRPNIEVRAGVRVTGTLLAPRVQLYSVPDMPEGEKLSWVVLGRATIVTGAEGSSMQQAALGLAAGQLGGRLASGLGLDELGLSEEGVTLGKRISNELYLTYQQGLAGAASTLFIFYDITRRLTLRAQASEASAVDLVYTISFE